ncbi:hypothetical protein ACRAWD_02840 [Caulobacter segnis]
MVGDYFADEDAKRQSAHPRPGGHQRRCSVRRPDRPGGKDRGYAAFHRWHGPPARRLRPDPWARYTHDEKTASLIRTDFVRPACRAVSRLQRAEGRLERGHAPRRALPGPRAVEPTVKSMHDVTARASRPAASSTDAAVITAPGHALQLRRPGHQLRTGP